MWKKLVEQKLPVIFGIVGCVFLFGAFFQIADFTKLAIKPQPTHQPAFITGALLIALSVALAVYEHSRTSSATTAGMTDDDIVDLLSGGPVIVLRHMAAAGDYRPASFFARALARFNEEHHPTDAETKAWRKASQYAVLFLVALGLAKARPNGGEYIITERGKQIASGRTLHSKFTNACRFPVQL
jgi:hypothetical protein